MYCFVLMVVQCQLPVRSMGQRKGGWGGAVLVLVINLGLQDLTVVFHALHVHRGGLGVLNRRGDGDRGVDVLGGEGRGHFSGWVGLWIGRQVSVSREAVDESAMRCDAVGEGLVAGVLQ